MRTEHISDQDICLYVDALKLHRTGQLPPEVISHVSDCAECKGQVMQLYDALKEEDYVNIGGHPVLTPQANAGPGPSRFLFRIAAALAVMLACGAVAYWAFVRESPGVHPPSQATTEGVADTGRPGGKEDSQPATPAGQYADNFIPSPNMEDLVGAGFRAASVVVEAPVNGQVRSDDIVFRWKSRGTRAFRVRILSNREEEIFQEVTNRDSVVYTKGLLPGLYYWTLQEDGELVYVGKLTVPVP